MPIDPTSSGSDSGSDSEPVGSSSEPQPSAARAVGWAAPLDDERVSDAWHQYRQQVDLDEYDTRWDRMAADGHHVHGEADFVMRFAPERVLDAGCGAGRVAIELHRRGVAVTGIDLDPDLLDRARRRAPDLAWRHLDLADLVEVDPSELGGPFDLVVLAGNVLPFVRSDRRPAAVAGLARQLRPGGRLVAGATLAPGWPTIDDHDRWCTAAGLRREARFGGWSAEPLTASAGYAVHVHRAGGGVTGR